MEKKIVSWVLGKFPTFVEVARLLCSNKKKTFPFPIFSVSIFRIIATHLLLSNVLCDNRSDVQNVPWNNHYIRLVRIRIKVLFLTI